MYNIIAGYEKFDVYGGTAPVACRRVLQALYGRPHLLFLYRHILTYIYIIVKT